MTAIGEIHNSKDALIKSFNTVRALTETLCQPLEIEDYVIQSMPEVSPTRWHLAHTAWFFETFLLKPELPEYQSPNELYNFLFNSYYNAVGAQYTRSERGLLSRPTVAEVFEYRHHVDEGMINLIETLDDARLTTVAPLIALGLNHEQQHQELMLTDIKHVFSKNPLYPVYSPRPIRENVGTTSPLSWSRYSGGVVEVGHSGAGFAFDNESPRHEALLTPFELANRLVTNGEYLDFILDSGYEQAALWLSDGWALIHQEHWNAPLYWIKQDDSWSEFTLFGLQKLDPNSPVTHLSFYEADAFANWSNTRLPSEFEWEFAAQKAQVAGNFVEAENFHPRPAITTNGSEPQQMYGDVWEWTRSPYTPYPGFKADKGAVGEYNGKFMSSQMVLKGGSCVSSQNHLRSSYRNFFYPQSRWQFMGLRLARDI